ncbi:GpE family phage tail protein [Paracoccus aminovorans]|nr:GpE family phage tail protein [Paracoccus aminovorans]
MADLAVVFHWPPDALSGMSLEELGRWWAKARARAAPAEDADG